MTDLEATKIAAYLATLYDVPAWTEERIRAFAAAIGDLPCANAQQAAQRYVATHRDRPQPADIRALVVEAHAQLPEPEAAWSDLLDAILGHIDKDEICPEILQAVYGLGHSWHDLRYMQFDQYPWLRRDFLSAYRELRDRIYTQAQTGEAPIALPDRADAKALLAEIDRHAQKTIA